MCNGGSSRRPHRPGAPAGDGPHLLEVGGVQAQANNMTDASLESSRRMMGLLLDTQDAGQNTLTMLDAQVGGQPNHSIQYISVTGILVKEKFTLYLAYCKKKEILL